MAERVVNLTLSDPPVEATTEGFFAKLTCQRLKRGVFRSVVDLRGPSTGTSLKPMRVPSLSPGRLIRMKSSLP
ncbi:hypothetical protein GGD56_005722 [Rhizobium mongolense]|uniref:Uncharacterized protein n=1 Tax=Rhizobium mongolense TaxID=57676 RepID=A0ABR6IVY9_9HYPH|nr:hypothetical protein [Rhizobium mongolense]